MRADECQLSFTLASSTGAALPSSPIRAQSVNERGAVAVLLLAVALGGLLRFADLGNSEMSADEAASWAAANAPSLKRVLELQPILNPGKFAIHEIALHGWIQLFGDGLAAMRGLSAITGTLAIVAVFFIARELLGLDQAITRRTNPNENGDRPSSMPAAAFAAVLFAVNLVFIKYAQEARMYSVALLAALMQIGLFLRSLHRPTPPWLFLTGVFTALAIASTFTMFLILPPEVLWLAYLGHYRHPGICHRAALVGLAMISGLALLIAPAITYLHAREHAPALLAYAWASRPPLWAPLSMFNKATGNIGFPLALALALWGWARAWSRELDAVVFVLFWMLVPPIMVLSASYLVRPAFVERYMLASFVPFFLLVALGLWRVHGVVAQYSLLALIALTALGHVYSYRQHPHDVEWREAVQAAIGTPGHAIVVAPPYAAEVARYYLRKLHSDWAVETIPDSSAAVAIVADTGVSPTEAARISTAFPSLLIRLRGVIVREHEVPGG
jgi:mannosyltransferase